MPRRKKRLTLHPDDVIGSFPIDQVHGLCESDLFDSLREANAALDTWLRIVVKLTYAPTAQPDGEVPVATRQANLARALEARQVNWENQTLYLQSCQESRCTFLFAFHPPGRLLLLSMVPTQFLLAVRKALANTPRIKAVSKYGPGAWDLPQAAARLRRVQARQ